MPRIAVTMRLVQAHAYHEVRDALAHDWPHFLRLALPDAMWLPIPNLGEETVPFARGWGINGIVLTGGDDIGEDVRTTSETRLLHWALSERLPVVGICRGAQLAHLQLGGALSPCDPADHVARRHPISALPAAAPLGFRAGTRTVNSFHERGIADGCLPAAARALATAEDGMIEAFVHESAPVVGLMWHPEREASPHPDDVRLFRTLFSA